LYGDWLIIGSGFAGISAACFLAKSGYNVTVLDKEYTIEAKQWKADTLYSVVKGKPNKELKFHKNEIALSDVKIRKFSKGKSDALTVADYALVGVGLFLLLK
jgi:heterodisulfide reductase subunit A-like polyferredoxin